MLLIVVFVVNASVTAWRRGDRQKARMVGGSVAFFILAGLGTSSVVLWGNVQAPIVVSQCYLGLVLVMGYELSRDVLRASKLVYELQAIEARNSAILRAVPDLMFLQTKDGAYIDYHAPDDNQLLMRPDQFLGRNMREVLPPAALRTLGPSFQRAAEGQEPVPVEYELQMPDRARRYEARMVPCKDDQVLSIVRDITERKQAEAALREGQNRYALATSAGGVGVWDWNLETGDIYVDPALKAILGFEDHELSR